MEPKDRLQEIANFVTACYELGIQDSPGVQDYKKEGLALVEAGETKQ